MHNNFLIDWGQTNSITRSLLNKPQCYANEDSYLYCISKKGLKVLPFFSGDWGGCCGRTIAVLVSLSEGLDLPLKASKVSAVSKTISSDNCWSLHNDMF